MKTLTFKYTKADGKVSDRVLVVSAEPNKFFAGTDISSLSDEDQVAYINAIQKAKDVYLDAIKDINDHFDLNFNFRQFDPTKMSDVVEEDI
jgi:enoyl-CoA hydratase/carnithine racemase